MLPLAPGLLSTTTAWPSAACMAAATGRSEMSDGPAGGLGTTMRMGLALGHSWARAGAAHSTAAVRATAARAIAARGRSEEHTSELQSPCNLVCRLLLEKKKTTNLANPRRRPHSGTPPTAPDVACL